MVPAKTMASDVKYPKWLPRALRPVPETLRRARRFTSHALDESVNLLLGLVKQGDGEAYLLESVRYVHDPERRIHVAMVAEVDQEDVLAHTTLPRAPRLISHRPNYGHGYCCVPVSAAR